MSQALVFDELFSTSRKAGPSSIQTKVRNGLFYHWPEMPVPRWLHPNPVNQENDYMKFTFLISIL